MQDKEESAYYPIIQTAAKKHGVDENLVLAIIRVESNFNTWAVRVEPKWRYFYFSRTYAENLNITFETETICQGMSWGLVQIMGSVTRELGYKDHLTKLLYPEINLEYGCMKLKSLDIKYGGHESDVIAAYNAGSVVKTVGGMYRNQGYLDKVYRQLLELRKLK